MTDGTLASPNASHPVSSLGSDVSVLFIPERSGKD